MNSVSWPRWHLFLTGALLVLLGRAGLDPAGAAAPPVLQAATAHGAPLLVENVGQFAPGARFALLSGPGMVWLAEDAMWTSALDAAPLTEGPGQGTGHGPMHGAHVRLSFVGANRQPRLEPFDARQTHISYLLGADPAGWHPDVPTWGALRYRDLYPGVDLVIAAGAESADLPWHLETRAGADLARVQLRVEGAQAVRVEGQGLRLSTAAGEVRLPLLGLSGPAEARSPAAQPSEVREVGPGTFQVTSPLAAEGAASEGRALEGASGLGYSTFLGGSQSEFGYGIAAETTGATYLAGATASMDFPTTPGAFDITFDEVDAFVVKMNAAGSGLVYGTFLGGSAFERGYAVAVANGLAYLTGFTESNDFPLAAGTNQGASDVFVAALNTTGTDLVYARLLGGSDADEGNGIAVESGNAYVTGGTSSANFPASGSYQGVKDAFVAKLNASGGLVYATYLGGSLEDAGFGIAVQSGNAYVTGKTDSSDFPGGGFQGGRDAFVTKLNTSGGVAYSRLIGGSGIDTGHGIAVDSTGAAHVAGTADSADFPAASGARPVERVGARRFAPRLSSAAAPALQPLWHGRVEWRSRAKWHPHQRLVRRSEIRRGWHPVVRRTILVCTRGTG